MSEPDKVEEIDGIKGLVLFVLKMNQAFFRHFKLLALAGIIGVSLGGYIGYGKKADYQSDFSILIEGQSGGGLSKYLNMARSLGIGLGGSGGGSALTPDNFSELLKSRNIIYSALLDDVEIEGKKVKLINYYFDNIKRPKTNIKAYDKKINKDYYITCNEAFTCSKIDQAVLDQVFKKLVMGSIIVETSTKTSIIKLSIVSKDENFSYLMAKSILDNIYTFYETNLKSKKEDFIKVAEGKADSVYVALGEKQKSLAVLSDNSHRLVKNAQKIKKVNLMQEIELLSTIYLSSMQTLEMAKFSSLEKTAVFKILDEPFLPILPKKKGLIFYGFVFGALFVIFALVFIFVRQRVKEIRLELKV